MPKLRDYFFSDLNTFFNQDEFAEIHNINGQEIECIVEKQDFDERSRQPAELYTITDGIYLDSVVVYCKTEDFPSYRLPKIGESLSLDDEDFNVGPVSDEGGVLRITLIANRA